MDPNAALAELRRLMHNHDVQPDVLWLDGFMNQFEALDEWLSKGGFLPEAWQKAGVKAAKDELRQQAYALGQFRQDEAVAHLLRRADELDGE